MPHTLTLWTNDARMAAWADGAGVDRIGVDLETLGKRERQRGLATWISAHTLLDLERVGRALRRAELFVRANPLHAGSAKEVDALLRRGVTVIMLPNFASAAEVRGFLDIVGGRARVVPLLERLAARDAIPEIARLGVQEVHLGLNDLSIDLGLAHHLSALAAPVVEAIANAVVAAGMKLCVGGLGRAMDESLPVASDLVYAQQIRIRSSGALLARSFSNAIASRREFEQLLSDMRARLDYWSAAPQAQLDVAYAQLLERIAELESGTRLVTA